jgi:dihydroorotase
MADNLLVAGGRIFDPIQKKFRRADIAITDGRIGRISPALPFEKGMEKIDASGCIVTPGLIDLHVHIFWLVHRISIHPHQLVPRGGTTTLVDAGSSGAANFDALKEFVLAKSELNLLAFLNISVLGMVFEMQIPGIPAMHEYEDLRLVNVAETVKCIEANRNFIVGLKVRAYHGLTNIAPIHAALEAGEATGLPVMIHTSPPPPTLGEYIPLLRSGDIVTHVYHPSPGGLLDRHGKIRKEYRAARERGVLMETGFDRAHTDFEVMKRGIGEGFWPDIISTDVTRFNVEPLVRDVLFTASKVMAAGLPLEEALVAMTLAPARAMGRPELAEVKEGGQANLTLLDLIEGEVEFVDFFGKTLKGKSKLCCRLMINRGKVYQKEFP